MKLYHTCLSASLLQCAITTHFPSHQQSTNPLFPSPQVLASHFMAGDMAVVMLADAQSQAGTLSMLRTCRAYWHHIPPLRSLHLWGVPAAGTLGLRPCSLPTDCAGSAERAGSRPQHRAGTARAIAGLEQKLDILKLSITALTKSVCHHAFKWQSFKTGSSAAVCRTSEVCRAHGRAWGRWFFWNYVQSPLEHPALSSYMSIFTNMNSYMIF